MTNIASPDMQTDDALPAGWRRARLGEVCEIMIGRTPPRRDKDSFGGRHQWVKISDMNQPVIVNTEETLSDKGAQICNGRVIKEGTLLYSFKLSIGKTAFAGTALFTNEAIAGLTPKDDSIISKGFLRYALTFGDYGSSADVAAKGKTLNKKKLAELPVPLPPLSEQERIARVLDECLSSVARAKDAAEAQLAAAVALPGAYLRQALPAEGDDLPAGWKWARLGEVCEVINGYGFKVRLQGRKGLPYPFIKVSDMNADGAEKVVSTASNTVDSSILKQLKAKTFPIGTIVFPKVGAALLTNKRRILGAEATFDNNVMGLIPKDVSSIWVYYWMLTIDLSLLSNIQALPSVRKSDIETIPIPLPPLDEQGRIASELDARIAAAGTLASRVRDQLEAIDALPGAYLSKAFAGEI